jgi:hypothetical protein
MQPMLLLICSLAAVGVMASVVSMVRAGRRSRLEQVAREHGYHYSAVDRFHLAPRLASAEPAQCLPDGSVVRDVMYRQHDQVRRFIVRVVAPSTTGEHRADRILRIEECCRDCDKPLRVLGETFVREGVAKAYRECASATDR